MRAAQVTRLDGPDAVEVVDLPEPDGDGVVVEVVAAGICFPDVLLTRGQYQITPDLPFVPGSEVAGIVRSAPVSSGYAAGDRVAAFPFLGGFAEVVEADAAMVFPLPDSVTFEQGSALPMNYLTCHFALRERRRLHTRGQGEPVAPRQHLGRRRRVGRVVDRARRPRPGIPAPPVGRPRAAAGVGGDRPRHRRGARPRGCRGGAHRGRRAPRDREDPARPVTRAAQLSANLRLP